MNQANAWNSLYFVRHIFQTSARIALVSILLFTVSSLAANREPSGAPQVKICELLTASSNARGISAIKLKLADFIGSNSALEKTFALSVLEAPKNPMHGDFAVPVFSLAKSEKKSPPEIANALAEKLNAIKPGWIASFEAVGGFLNVRLTAELYQEHLQEVYREKGAQYGYAEWAEGKRVVIDYVSPNLAKPLHIGHFRASVIGQSIRNLAETQGFEVTGLNHLGDWGIQFGYLIWGYQNWKSEYDFENKPFDSLYNLYVRVKAEAKTNAELEAGGREIFLKMEAGDKDVLAIWEMFREITMTENNKVLAALNIKHDLVLGESFYNDKLAYLEERLKQLSLLTESDGALGVCVSNDRFCLLRTTAGTSVYAARDLASALYRHNELKADEILYVVGNEQKDHFKLVFEVLGLMGESWVKDLHHVGFGLYLNNGKKISSRDGGTLTIDELINTATERASKFESDPVRARKLAMAGLIFNDLQSDRNGDVDFDWDRLLNMEGGGPAIMNSVERATKSLAERDAENIEGFKATLVAKEEIELASVLVEYQEAMTTAYVTYQPSALAQYLWRVSRAYNAFAQTQLLPKDAADKDRLASQMYLTRIARDVMAQGLRVMNIEPF